MQEIRDLSIEDLLTKLKEHRLCPIHETISFCKRNRKVYEKQLFLQVQEKEASPPNRNVGDGGEYFLLDINLPQTWFLGKSILKKTPTKKSKKTVHFKLTEIFGDEPIYPYCVERRNSNISTQHLHAPECSNAIAETIEVLGQYRCMNRKSLIEGRYAI